MTRRVNPDVLVARAEIVAAPARRACDDQNFGLPRGIYAAMGLLFAGFVTVLASAFRTDMAVSYGIVFAFLAAFFAVPVLFVRAAPSWAGKALSWRDFAERGIDTATGRTGAGEATALVLMLPLFMLGFATAVAIIAALV